MTFSALISILKHMADIELHENSEDTALIAGTKRKVNTYLLEKYSKKELLEVLYVVSSLNPRFKIHYYTNAIRWWLCFLRWSNRTHKRKGSNWSSAFCSSWQCKPNHWNKWPGPSAAKKRTLGSILKRNKEVMLPKTPHDRLKAETHWTGERVSTIVTHRF